MKNNMYKLPLKDANWIVKSKNKGNIDPLGFKKSILEGVRLFIQEHKDIDLPRLNGSLAKRITMFLNNHYIRMLSDKYILDYLCENRIDLSKIKGELRNNLMNKMRRKEQKRK